MPEPARLLVLCTANVCRSPLGAALVDQVVSEHLSPGAVEVTSAGTHARAGEPAAPETARIAARWRLDLADHHARPLTRDLVASADLILAMEDAHRVAALRMVPSALPRTFTWLELARLAPEVGQVRGRPGTPARLSSVAREAHRARPWVQAPTGSEDVADPVGRSARHFKRMAAALVESATAFLPLILLERPVDP